MSKLTHNLENAWGSDTAADQIFAIFDGVK